MPPFWAKRSDGDRFVIENEAEEVGVMDGEVEDGAGSGDRIGEPPALEMLRQIAGMDDARRQRAPDPSGA